MDPNYTFTYVPGTLIVTSTMPVRDYLGALSSVEDIGSADHNWRDERQNNVRFARNYLLLQIIKGGIRCRRV